LRRILLDAGPIVAIFSARDAHHSICVEHLASIKAPLFTCWPVITEAAWLLRQEPAAIGQVLSMLNEGLFGLLALEASAAPAISSLLVRYRHLGAQLADAALVYLAEREDIDTVFTLDKRDFTVYRTSRGRRLRIIPE
jgi:predicted nucleic acid-binding protein